MDHRHFAAATFVLFVALNLPVSARTTTPFDSDWRFLKADAPDAERADFDDSKGAAISLSLAPTRRFFTGLACFGFLSCIHQ